MLDEKTKQAISFLDSIYEFSINAEEIDYAIDVFNLLCSAKKYTPHSKVFLSPQLIYDILDVELVVRKQHREAKELGKLPELFGIQEWTGETPKEEIVKRTWKKIYRKYSEKDICSVVLDKKFILEVLDTSIDVYLEHLEEPHTEETDTSPEYHANIIEQFKTALAVSDLIREAEKLLKLNRDRIAMRKIEEALALNRNHYTVFDIHLRIAEAMEKRKDYHEAIHQLYLGISYSEPFFVYGKPTHRDNDFPIFIEMDDGKIVNSEYVFQQIKEAIALMERIPVEESTVPERKKLCDTISTMVLKLEEWQSKEMID